MSDSVVPAGGAFLLETSDPQLVFIPEEFDAEDHLIAKTAEGFMRNEVLPHVEQIEQRDFDLMERLLRRAGELGLLGPEVPAVYGGLGLKQTTSALVSEKISLQGSFAIGAEAHSGIATLPLLFFGTDDQKRRYLPKLARGEWIASFALSEEASASDSLAAKTNAVLSPDGKHYILNGAKMWITNSAFSKLFTVFGQVDGDKFTAFLVERDFEGVSFGKELRKMGMHGSSTRRVILDNVHVPVENVMEIGKGRFAAFDTLNMGRFMVGAGAIGGLKENTANCVRYAKQRKAFGKTLADFGLVQHKLAEMAARTFAVESMVYRLAGYLDRLMSPIVADAPDASEKYHRAANEYSIECGIVKLIGSETSNRMADEAIQIHGGNGYTEEYSVARSWRDGRLTRIGEGATDVVRQMITGLLLRKDMQGRLAVREAGARVAHALEAPLPLSPPRSGEGETDALEAISCAAQDVRQLGLFLTYQATERLGMALVDEQEILGAIADVVCATYAIESVWLRCLKLRDRSHPRFATALLASQVATHDYARDAFLAACDVLDSLPPTSDAQRDEPCGLSALLNRLVRSDLNPKQLRRDLAAQVLDRDGYPL